MRPLLISLKTGVLRTFLFCAFSGHRDMSQIDLGHYSFLATKQSAPLGDACGSKA
jgi:hypothetical protein